MYLGFSPTALTTNIERITADMTVSVERQLLRAVSLKGDYPTSLNLVEPILKGEKYGMAELAERLSYDPILALRLLALSNHGRYARGKAVLTVPGAAHAIGSPKMSEILSDSTEIKNFQAIYLGRAVSSIMLHQSMLCMILSRRICELIAEKKKELADQAVPLSVLLNAPFLLLAYYKPNLYSACYLDAFRPDESIERNFRRMIGKSVTKFSQRIADALPLPKELEQVMTFFDIPPWKRRSWAIDNAKDVTVLVHAVYVANVLAESLSNFMTASAFTSLVRDLCASANIDRPGLNQILAGLAGEYIQHCQMLGLKALRLPDYLVGFGSESNVGIARPRWPSISERINPFLYELRACFKTKSNKDEYARLPQAVHCTLHALVKGLNFDRAAVFNMDPHTDSLELALMLGAEEDEMDAARQSISDSRFVEMPHVQAVLNKQPVFFGEPIYGDDWPFAAFPVIRGTKVAAVFYADKKARTEAVPLETYEQVAVIALAEEWHDIPQDFS